MATDVLQVELSRQEIARMRKQVALQNAAFTDKRYLDSMYLPSGIIGRPAETEKLLGYIEGFRKGLIVPLVSVYGRSGTGKSTVIKFVCQNVEDIASTIFVNLRKSKTIFGCTNLILSELGSAQLKSYEGTDNAIDRMQEKIEKILSIENKKLFLLVLDEYDAIFSDTRSNPSDFVYKLLTLEENLKQKGLLLCIITISNSTLYDYYLDDRVKSRIGSWEVFFPPYEKETIVKILRERAGKGLARKVNDNVLELCATLSSDEHGDCRRSIDLLRSAAELAGEQEITPDHIEKALSELEVDRIEHIIKNLTGQQRVILASIAKLVLFSREEIHSTAEIYTEYVGQVGSLRSLGNRRVFDLLMELETFGIIVSKNRSRGRGGYATEYKLTAPTWVVGNALDKDWWYGQVDEKCRIEREQGESRKKFKPSRDAY